MRNDQSVSRLDLGRRRLAFLSVHATGFNPHVDRIVEVAAVIRGPGSAEKSYHRLVDPGTRILPEATEVHGVTDDRVIGAGFFSKIAPGLHRFLGVSDLAGFGIRRLAVPMLMAEFHRESMPFLMTNRVVVDLEEIDRHHHRRDFDTVVADYLGDEARNRTGAQAKAEACARLLDAQLMRHEGLPGTVAGLRKYPIATDPTGLIREGMRQQAGTFVEGRHRGRTPEEVARIDPEFLRGLLGPGLPYDLRWHFEHALEKVEFEASANPKPQP